MLRHLRTLLIVLAAGATTLGAAAQARFDFAQTPGRLSKAVRPLVQALSFDVDPGRDRFDGETTLTLQLDQPQPALRLHAHQLEPGSAHWTPGRVANPRRERVLTVERDEAGQTWLLRPADGQPLPRGRGLVRLSFSGRVQDNDAGLYRAPYAAAPGVRQDFAPRILATQLQAVFARMLFPTFDEPAFRSAFEISVRTPPGWEVLSNMPLSTLSQAQRRAERRAQPERVLHRFGRTPPMPSYLVALAVGRFDTLRGHAAGVPLRIVTVPGKREQGRLALEATQKLLPYYTRYFGQRYALPKLDQLAVPSTRSGAMEDWGLISYAEDTLLYDPATANTHSQREVFSVVAHEVAHQWFGNLVTAASWEEIWLNEAFATWMAAKASEHFNPQWQLPLRRRREIDQTMERDGGPATRAIRSGAVAENSVFDVFDDITYTKGGAVLAMLEAWIGETPFRRGLAAYMRERRLSNATAGDLWFHIGRAAGRDVAAVAASWTDQRGFPLVGVDARCEAGSTRLVLTQRAFGDTTTTPRLWQVPLELLHGGRRHTLLLAQAQQELQLPGCPALPTVVNPAGVGFYRVSYAEPARAALAKAFAELPAAVQVTLLSDGFALAQTGLLPVADWLQLVAQLPASRGEGRAALFAQAGAGLRVLRDALTGSPAAAALDGAARALLAPELQRLGWVARPGEDSETEALRASLIASLSRYGDGAVNAQAAALFEADEAGRAPLAPATRAAVIVSAGRTADAARHQALQRRLLAAAGEEDRWLFAEALAAAPDAALLPQTLALTLDERLPANVATRLPSLVARAGHHREAAYAHVVQHWNELARRAGDMFGARAWLLPGAAGGFNTEAEAARLLADQQRLQGEPGRATAERAAARIRLLAALREREAERLLAPLQALQRGAP